MTDRLMCPLLWLCIDPFESAASLLKQLIFFQILVLATKPFQSRRKRHFSSGNSPLTMCLAQVLYTCSWVAFVGNTWSNTKHLPCKRATRHFCYISQSKGRPQHHRPSSIKDASIKAASIQYIATDMLYGGCIPWHLHTHVLSRCACVSFFPSLLQIVGPHRARGMEVKPLKGSVQGLAEPSQASRANIIARRRNAFSQTNCIDEQPKWGSFVSQKPTIALVWKTENSYLWQLRSKQSCRAGF